MPKYMVLYHWDDGTEDEDDNYGQYYKSEAEANDAGLYGLGCEKEGAEIMHMSNPGDYPFDEDDYDYGSFEIIEIED